MKTKKDIIYKYVSISNYDDLPDEGKKQVRHFIEFKKNELKKEINDYIKFLKNKNNEKEGK
ncbi:MAG: hypothetical protein E7F84_21010 [Clostridium butyricum]|nr:hypothetical protein [Clostridium butyricum]